MIYGEWQVEIQDDRATLNKNVFIFVRNIDGSDEMLQPDGETTQTIKMGEACRPTMKLREDVLQAFFNALSAKGMQPPKASFIEGKLEAVEAHLSDMRALVFEKPDEIINVECKKK